MTGSIRNPKWNKVARCHNRARFNTHRAHLERNGWRIDATDKDAWWCVNGAQGVYISPGELMIDRCGREYYYRNCKDLIGAMMDIAKYEREALEDQFRRDRST